MFNTINIYKSYTFFNFIPSVLIIFVPFFLITGPFLPDLAISLCSIIFLINSFRVSMQKYYSSIFFKIFIFFWFIINLSSLLSNNVLYSLETSFFYIRFGFFSLAFWYLIDINPKILKYLFFSFVISFFILILDGYFQFFNGYNIFGWKIIGSRISSFFKDELILGSYLSRLFPVFFALFIYFVGNKNKFFSFLFFVLFISIDVLVFLSGERAAFFFINFSALFIIILSSNYKLYRFLSFIFALICIILISINSPKFKEKIVDQTLNQIGLSTSGNKLKVFSLEHQNHYISALKMFQDNKIFGIGTKLFRKNCDKEIYKVSFESCTTHPHNTYIQLLSETGILGFGVVFLIFCIKLYYLIKHWLLKIFYKKIFFNDFQLSLLSGILITLWPFIPSGNFFNNWLSVIYYFPISILLWSLDQKSDNSTKT